MLSADEVYDSATWSVCHHKSTSHKSGKKMKRTKPQLQIWKRCRHPHSPFTITVSSTISSSIQSRGEYHRTKSPRVHPGLAALNASMSDSRHALCMRARRCAPSDDVPSLQQLIHGARHKKRCANKNCIGLSSHFSVKNDGCVYKNGHTFFAIFPAEQSTQSVDLNRHTNKKTNKTYSNPCQVILNFGDWIPERRGFR